jgi:hypothetical protein
MKDSIHPAAGILGLKAEHAFIEIVDRAHQHFPP